MKSCTLLTALLAFSLSAAAETDVQPPPTQVEKTGYSMSFTHSLDALAQTEREDLIVRAQANAISEAESECHSNVERTSPYTVNVQLIRGCGNFVQATASAKFACKP